MREKMQRFDKYMAYRSLNDNQVTQQCGLSQGLLGQARTGKSDLGTKTIEKILNVYQDLNRVWLLTGEGEMLKKGDAATADDAVFSAESLMQVPLFSLDAVAGFGDGKESVEFQEGWIPWSGARCGDFAVHVTGDSMSPKIPNGSVVLARPYQFKNYEDLEFGRPHIIVTNDNRVLLKVIKMDTDTPRRLLLVSFNPDYPPRSISVGEIIRVYLAVSVQAPL